MGQVTDMSQIHLECLGTELSLLMGGSTNIRIQKALPSSVGNNAPISLEVEKIIKFP